MSGDAMFDLSTLSTFVAVVLPLASQPLSVPNDISVAGLRDRDRLYVPAYWAVIGERNRGF
jgi:3-hydroxyisobutyrate dehydrogenase